MGKHDASSIGSGLVNQLWWLVIGLIVFHLLWRVAVKRYSAVGA